LRLSITAVITDTYGFDIARHRSGAALLPEHVADFQRLLKDLRYGSRFQLLIAECRDEQRREVLIGRLDAVLTGSGLRAARLRLTDQDPADASALEAALTRLAAEHDCIHIAGADAWLDEQRWRALNLRRELIAERAPVRLVLWLAPQQVARMPDLAPDLWAWRADVFAFPSEPQALRSVPVPNHVLDRNSAADRARANALLCLALAAARQLGIPEMRRIADILSRAGMGCDT
jgi:hypothetical protein